MGEDGRIGWCAPDAGTHSTTSSDHKPGPGPSDALSLRETVPRVEPRQSGRGQHIWLAGNWMEMQFAMRDGCRPMKPTRDGQPAVTEHDDIKSGGRIHDRSSNEAHLTVEAAVVESRVVSAPSASRCWGGGRSVS